jgi:NADPH:quinone reductase
MTTNTEMRAVLVERYDAIDAIKIHNVSIPSVAVGEVRVKVQTVGVGFVDGLKVRGLYQTKDPLPFIPGSEFAGTVDEIGADVTGYAPGQPVLGFARSGALAEFITVPASAVKPMPGNMPFPMAASFWTNYLTGLYALTERAYLQPGETLLVLGAAGGVGIAAVQIGKMLGARVIAAASTREKRDFAIAHGADAAIDYTKPNWRDDLKVLVGEKAVDVVYDPVGGDIGLLAFRTLAWRGRHLVVGFAAGAIPALPYNLPLLKGASLVGVDIAQVEKREPEIERRISDKLFTWLENGALKPVVGQVFPFEEFQHAFRAMRDRKAEGKMVISIL